jgi:hypothetical protein
MIMFFFALLATLSLPIAMLVATVAFAKKEK